MSQSIFELGWRPGDPKDDKIYGVAIATVLNNIDELVEARVQIGLPWAPGIEPWARIATLAAGSGSGSFFVPQVGDEVLVAFNQGDIHDPFIIGALWNTEDRPPSSVALDAVNKRIIRTPLGQVITFDDLKQSLTITNSARQTLSLEAASATLSTPAASVTLGIAGDLTIKGSTRITIQAPTITLEGENVQISGSAAATLNGGMNCTILGTTVNIG
jgi:uncharacterized protein involved in type VI secretion and phage assembly